MLGSFISLITYSTIGGGAIGNLLFSWEQAGVFSYVLPFLVIFALIFGILSKMTLFGENSKGINAIVSIAVGLMALQFNMVSVFFSEIFPRMGVALSVILVLVVVAGLFFNTKNKGFFNGLMIFALIVVGIVTFSSFSSLGFFSGFGGGFWWSYNWDSILGIVIFVVAIILIISPSFKSKEAKIATEHDSHFYRSAGGK